MKKITWFTSALIILLVCLMTGCTTSGNISETGNKLMECKDTRDGEVFRFNTKTITNIRVGFLAPTTFDLVTLDGRKKSLSDQAEAWLKCEEVN